MSPERQRGAQSRAIIGWDGIRFSVPADWNITGVSAGGSDGYLKVDSPGTMFMQVKWSDPLKAKPRTLAEIVGRVVRRIRKAEASPPALPDLRAMLDAYLKDTGKRARKAGQSFNCRIKPETSEAGGERVTHHFSWTGSGHGQGKIWHCKRCGRTVIAQVVGQAKDPVADVAASVFSDMRDHPEDGWVVWGAFDLIAGVPSDLQLRAHQFMSGYLKLEFARPGKGRVVIERWGLARVVRRRFTLKEWLQQTVGSERYRPAYSDIRANEHDGVMAAASLRGLLQRVMAVRDALPTLRPATEYEACVWECTETDKLYAVQMWRPRKCVSIIGDLVARCECH